MTAETDLLPLPEYFRRDLSHMTWEGLSQAAINYASANVAHAVAPLQAEIEALRAEVERLAEALKEILSRSAMNLAMNPNPFELTAMLGDIHQIADAALSKENSND